MALHSKPLSQVTEIDLRALVENQVPEGLTLDYKRDAVGNTDGEKKEFLRDLSSFSNAAGGHLIFGVQEDGGVPTDLRGIALADSEQEKLRLEQMARDGINPVITGLQTHAVKLTGGQWVVVIRVPRSLNPPHQVVFQKDFRIYGRNSSGKHPLASEEIRAIVTGGQELVERIRSWRINRIASIGAGEGSLRRAKGPYIVVQTVPLEAFARGEDIEVDLALKNLALFLPRSIGPGDGINYAFNLDGMLVWPAADSIAWSVQIYRTGALEHVQILRPVPSGDNKNWIDGVAVDRAVTSWLEQSQRIYEHLAITGPVVMLAAIVGLRGFRVNGDEAGGHHPVDRDPILLPDLVVETWGVNKRQPETRE